MNLDTPPSLPAGYRDRIYAGWLGKCIGVRLGAPVENWTYQEIQDNLGEIRGFLPLPPGTVFKPDDDTAFPLVLIRALEDYGPEVTAQQMGEMVLNYLADQRGTLWWGGYGVSTEHTAYLNLAHGIPAPRSGSAAQNGKTVAEQIGGQIFSDIWGLVAPGAPERAAEYAARASSVTHGGEGIHGGRFVAGLVSHAFVEGDPRRLVERGLALLPPQSEYARVVQAMLDFHAQESDDWRAAYHFLAGHFGYDRYPGVVPIIPNAGVVVLALLYGQGDFSRAIQIATMCGWDTDCNVGNVGAIMGVAVGLAGIDLERWRAPMNDILVAASVIGTRNLTTIPACADLFHRLGVQLAGEPEPRRYPRVHFDYPGSTQGIQAHAQRGRIIALEQLTLDPAVMEQAQGGRGVLRAVLRKLNKKGEARLFVRTYLRPQELSANHYKASFSPLVYPGQTLQARLYLPPGSPRGLRAGLFVWDDNHEQALRSPAEPLAPGHWHTLHFSIPEQANALFTQAGVVLRNLADAPWSGSLWLDFLDWEGPARFVTDFSRERPEYDAISGWTFSRGHWRLEDGAYHGSAAGLGESYTGHPHWRDLALTVDLVPLLGKHHNVNLRVQGTRRSYAVGLAPDGRVVLYKASPSHTMDSLLGPYRPVVEAAFPWRLGEGYRLFVLAEGANLAVSLARLGEAGEESSQPRPLLLWSDPHQPYLHGQIGLSVFGGSHTRYQRLAVSGR